VLLLLLQGHVGSDEASSHRASGRRIKPRATTGRRDIWTVTINRTCQILPSMRAGQRRYEKESHLCREIEGVYVELSERRDETDILCNFCIHDPSSLRQLHTMERMLLSAMSTSMT
jgi:hypothetical protein